MKPTRTILALFAALLTLPLVAVGQGDEASNDDAIEDIVVVGQKSVSSLRRGVFEAEEDFYSVFNKLNDEKDFDVRCRYEKLTGTNIKNHICRARFVTKAFDRHASRNRNNLYRAANMTADSALEARTVEYQAKVEELIAAHPELQAALERYNASRAQFLANRSGNDSN